MDLSIIIATYNEVDNIAPLVLMVRDALATVPREGGSPLNYEVIIVDDGSPDGTGEVVDALAAKLPFVKPVHRTGKLGLGSAYRAALKTATGAWTVIMDADFSHNPADLPRLIARQRDTGADIVCATRYSGATGSGVVGWPLYRYLTSGGANNAFIVTGLRGVSDVTGSYRLYNTSILRDALTATEATGYAFQPEVLVHAAQHGARIAELPILFVDRWIGETKFGMREIAGVMGAAVRLWWTRPWPVREPKVRSKSE